MDKKPTDWRGTPIEVDSLVVYGAPVGRSIALVEGIVAGFTKSGRVNVRIIRRAYGSFGWKDEKEVVHVGRDRLTVVTELPPSEVPTEAEKRAESERKRLERERNYASHVGVDVKSVERVTINLETGRPVLRSEIVDVPCEVCGCSPREAYQTPCPGAVEVAA